MTTQTHPRLGRDWRLLWTASAVSTVGDGAFLAVLPLLAATMTSDPRLVAGVTAWGTLPWLLAALPAGALVDRMDARRAMTSVQLVQGVLVASLAAATMAHAGRLAVLYAVAFAVGVAETMAKVAAQKLVPAVVSADRLEQANGTQNATMFAALGFVGPLVGTTLFTVATPLPFWADVATYALSAVLVARIAAPTRPSVTAARRALRREILDGLHWLARHRLLRTLSLLSGVANFANYLAQATLVLFARERLGLGHLGYGLLLALMATGGIAGSLASRRILARFGGRAVVVGTIFSTPTALIAIGLFARDLVTMAVLASVTTVGASLWNVASGSLRQRSVPAEILGRVTSVGLLLAWGAQPLGAVASGLVAGWFGLAAPWLIAGGIRLAAALLALPTLRRWP
jgi:MFS family permease